MNILLLYYSMYAHIHALAKGIEKGAKFVKNTKVEIKQILKILSDEVLEKMGAIEAKKKMKDPIAKVEVLEKADATPTRFGNMCAQIRAFLDATGSLWTKESLIGKIGAVFTSSVTQHGRQESIILNFYPNLLHHAMIIVGLLYSFDKQMQTDKIIGCSPYGVQPSLTQKVIEYLLKMKLRLLSFLENMLQN